MPKINICQTCLICLSLPPVQLNQARLASSSAFKCGYFKMLEPSFSISVREDSNVVDMMSAMLSNSCIITIDSGAAL